MSRPRITVVGSVNLDLVATGATLPAPGETVTGAVLARHPGGKGANQALAAARLGAAVSLVARVGADPFGEAALALLRAEGVDLSGVAVDPDAGTGVALIAVARGGENQIVVAPGANAAFTPDRLAAIPQGALICQLELPVATVARAMQLATGFVALNLAPATEVPPALLARADLVVVNEGEAAFYGPRLDAAGGLVAVTLGARGARLLRAGVEIATAVPPRVTAVDATSAGDAFVGALTVALVEGRGPREALAFACAAGALAAARPGAQPSLPRRAEVEAAAGLA
ncbi:PfkB family carbohydrate kinase [Phenylobacterium sp.]|uniref:PfkB family carbohydrate kinase n=1 Tax=Phenylobacterium sp. TaxID=1871053 RepID=UPI002F423527